MIPAVVVSLVLVTSTIALPLTVSETPQIGPGILQTVLPQQIEKTGVQTSETYTPTGQGTQTVHSEQYTGLNTPQQQQVEKTGYQTPSEVQSSQKQTSYNQENTAFPKVENVPVNVEAQSVYPQNPVLLPVQPLSVVPFNPTGQVFRPIVVPAEAIADGRVIIAPTESVQQRNFHQDVFTSPDTQVPHQHVTQITTYTAVQTQGTEPNQQSYNVQQTEKQTSVQQSIQPAIQDSASVYANSESFNKDQQIHTTSVVKQTAEPIQNFYQTQQNVPSVVTESVEKQATYEEATGQVPVQVESSSQQQQVHNVQETSEKQVPFQQTQFYTGAPILVENIQKQVQYQQSTGYQTQNIEPSQQQQVYNSQQTVEKQTQYQEVTSYAPVQNVQIQHVAEKTEKQGQYQQGYTQSQQQTSEKQASLQQSVQPVNYVSVQTHSVEPVRQQQVYSVQPEQVENQILHHQAIQQHSAEKVQEQILKTSEVEPSQQVVNVQPQQVVNYAGEPVYGFGDKVPEVHHNPTHTLSSVPLTQETVQPLVSSTQE